MEWRWGHGWGGAHGGAASGTNRAMALGFGWKWLGGASAFRSPCARRKEKGKANGAASAIGQARGVFKARLRRQAIHGAWPARQKAGDEWRTRGVKPLSRSATATDRFLKTNAIQCSSMMTDSTYSTIINS